MILVRHLQQARSPLSSQIPPRISNVPVPKTVVLDGCETMHVIQSTFIKQQLRGCAGVRGIVDKSTRKFGPKFSPRAGFVAMHSRSSAKSVAVWRSNN